MNASCNSLLAINKTESEGKTAFHNWRNVRTSKKIQDLQTPQFSVTMSNLLRKQLLICMEIKLSRVLAVHMYRKRGPKLGTFISNPLLCWSFARLLGLNLLCCGRDANKDIYCPWPAHFFWRAAVVLSTWSRSTAPQLQQKAMTFEWAGSSVAALWPSLISRCHRKWIVSLSRVTTTVRQHVRLSSDVIRGWRRRSGTDTVALIRAPFAQTRARYQTEHNCRYSRPAGRVLTNIMKCLR